MTRRRFGVLLASAVALIALTASGASAGDNDAGFKTSKPAFLEGKNGWTAEALISVGDTLPGGYLFEALPDGIAIDRINGRGTADILVNHELSLVPFPAARQDPSNSTVSKLRLSQHSGGVLKGEYVIPFDAGYQRFCSNFVVDTEHGFERRLLLTNEEARDTVLRQEDAWHQPVGTPPTPFGVMPGDPGAEQAGVVVAYDVKSGAFKSIYGMGRHNHENSVGIPDYGHPVVLSGDDTFDAPASQLYLYEAASGAAFWNDEGKLYAFVSDTAGINDYGDIAEAMQPVAGHFIEVPREIATGKLGGDPNARDITSLDYPDPAYPTPPTGIPDGPQWVLERWSVLHNAFQFIRIEDTAYDRGNPRVVYLADTGEPRAVAESPPGTRLRRASSGTNGLYMNGRIWKLTLGSNPLQAATLDILPGANFDLGGYANDEVVHQPDNVETTADALYITEDPGSHNSSSPPRDAQGNLLYPPFPDATNARVWRYDLTTGALTVVAEVNQSVPGAPTSLAKGTWESSGILDASSIFGPGAFLIDVQAHSWDMDAGTGNDPPAVPKRENGQLLLLRAPGS